MQTDLGVFESIGADPERRVERPFVIGTYHNGWRLNPVGVRFDIVHPKEIGDEPLIVTILFWNAQIRVIGSCNRKVKSVEFALSEYDIFPFMFTTDEANRLKQQLDSVNAEFKKLVGEEKVSA